MNNPYIDLKSKKSKAPSFNKSIYSNDSLFASADKFRNYNMSKTKIKKVKIISLYSPGEENDSIYSSKDSVPMLKG